MVRFLTTTVFLLCAASVSYAQDKEPLPKFGQLLIDWPIIGTQTKTDFYGGLFIGAGGHVALLNIANKVVIGAGTAITLTGEKRLEAEWGRYTGVKHYSNGYYDWLGRIAIAITAPITWDCGGGICASISPLYEVHRFNWTPGTVDTRSRSLGVAVHLSFLP